MDYELIPQSGPKGTTTRYSRVSKGKPVQGIKVGLGEDHPFKLNQ